MTTDNNTVLAKWNEIKALIENLEIDVVKNAEGNKAAGTRTRKGLRTVKTATAELIKLTLGKA